MKGNKNNIFFIGFFTLFLSFVTSCVEDETVWGDMKYELVLDTKKTSYDDNKQHDTTRSVGSVWENGDIIYLYFTNENIVGTATFSDGTWDFNYSGGSFKNNSKGSCRAYHFRGHINKKVNKTITFDEHTEIFRCSSDGTYSVSNNKLYVSATLTPKTWRIRFKDKAGTSFQLSSKDVDLYSELNLETGHYTHGPREISLTVSSDGYTPYVYGTFNTSDTIANISLKRDYNEYVRSLSTSKLDLGQSGYIEVPNSSNFHGWKRTTEKEVIESGRCGDNVYYTLFEDYSLIIDGNGDMYNNHSFLEYDRKREVISVTIKNGVTSIGSEAFDWWYSLTSVDIPNSVSSIGDQAFYGCSALSSVDIPNGVVSIGDQAFAGCSALTSVDIPNSVSSIGDQAFYGCSALSSITVNASNRFYDSRDNCNAIIESANNKLVVGCPKTIIPLGVKSIGDHAFHDCSSLTSIDIPNSVTSIGNQAFYECSALLSIDIPNSVTSIGDQAFSGCSALLSIDIPNSVTSIGDQAFSYCSSLKIIDIPNSVTSIGRNAFMSDSALQSAVIAYGVTKLYGTFKRCVNLTSVSIPNSVTRLDDTFSYCNSLKSVSIPNSVVSIDEKENYYYDDYDHYEGGTFRDCKSLTNVSIPNNVSYIGANTFNGCESLTYLKIPSSVNHLGGNAFSNCISLKSVEIEYGITCLDNVFTGCSSLTAVNIPNSVISLRGTFSDCSSLTSINIPNSVTDLGGTFSGCSSLTSINIPNSVTDLGGTFSGCSSLTAINIPNSVTYLNDTFSGCSSLTTVNIPNSVTRLDRTFIGCTKLALISIPKNVTDLSSTFAGCINLTSVSIPSSVKTIDHGLLWVTGLCDYFLGAFSGCKKLKSIYIPSSVESIGHGTFYGCSDLESIIVDSSNIYYSSLDNCNAIIEMDTGVLISGCKKTTIPKGVKEIGASAFGGIPISSISIPEGISSINEFAFEESSITSIVIPSSVLSIKGGAFCECKDLASIYVGENPPICEELMYYYEMTVSTFTGIPETCTLFVPKGCVNRYKDSFYWRSFQNIVEY